MSALWEEPVDLERRDLRNGPWGAANAPDPAATFTFLRPKTRGINPGMIVADPRGREWHVKQHAHNDGGPEGPAEVVLSRVLGAIGYHQPPVYFVPSFTVTSPGGTRVQPGGRFRLHVHALKEDGDWAWQANPFSGTRPLNGLFTILLLFNDTDFKRSNNSLYTFTHDGRVDHWYVVRDLGAALGDTTHFAPRGNDAARFERSRFITGVRDGFLEFDNRSPYRSLYERSLTPADAAWAGALLSRLSERQWQDAFSAGGYEPDVAAQFIRTIRRRIDQARGLAAGRQ